MSKLNLDSVIASGKSVVASATGELEEALGAAGKGAFGVNVGPNGVSISANFNQLIKQAVEGNRIVSPIKKLYSNQKTAPTLIFPSDLDNEHYILFNVIRNERRSRVEALKEATYQTIALPIPSNLTVQYNADYSNESLNVFGSMVTGAVGAGEIGDAFTSISDMISAKVSAAKEAFKNKDTDALTKALGVAGPTAATAGGAAVGSILGGGAGAFIGGALALGGTSGGVLAGLSVSEGLAINPHMAVVFQGVGFREHSFTYKFIARNKRESNEIKKIINVFRYRMLPSYAIGTLAYNYPDQFELVFADRIRPYLYEIGTCVLKSFNVNYNGEAQPLFFEDSGAPVSVEISMTFQETKIQTKETLEKSPYAGDLSSTEGSN